MCIKYGLFLCSASLSLNFIQFSLFSLFHSLPIIFIFSHFHQSDHLDHQQNHQSISIIIIIVTPSSLQQQDLFYPFWYAVPLEHRYFMVLQENAKKSSKNFLLLFMSLFSILEMSQNFRRRHHPVQNNSSREGDE